MAHIQCPKSGILWHATHMPLGLTLQHPIFSLDQKKLLSLAGQWAAEKITTEESYLLFLALLDSTSLVKWNTQASFTESTPAIVSSNMENLLSIIGKINLIKHPSFALPSFSINRETSTLTNVRHWIQVWIDSYNAWYDGCKEEELRAKLHDREEALQRLIKSSVPTEAYARTLASWAATAGSFPSYETIHPLSKQPIPLDEYWKNIIISISNEDRLWRFPRKDIVELIEHCEEFIQHGSIYSHTLMKYLRSGLAAYDDYLGFGSLVPTAKTSFTILPSTTSAYEASVAALHNTAPTEEPQRSQYPTQSAWLKAYTKWKLKRFKS